MKEPITLEEHQMLVTDLEWMYDRLGRIEEWMRSRGTKGGLSRTRNKLSRARYYIDQAEADLMGAANTDHGYMTGTRIYERPAQREQT